MAEEYNEQAEESNGGTADSSYVTDQYAMQQSIGGWVACDPQAHQVTAQLTVRV